MSDKLMALILEYLDMFGEGFPTYQICRTRTDEESVKIVRECLETGKDAYELGYATVEGDIEY